MLGNMLVLSDIEVLEHWLQVNSLDSHGLSILLKDVVDLSNFLVGHFKVLSSSQGCVLDGYWSNDGSWDLLNAVGGESTVDICAKFDVVEHMLWVPVSSIPSCQFIELLESQLEVEHSENALELILGNSSLSQLVKVIEKFLDSHSLHNNVVLKPSLDIVRVVSNLYSLLQIPIVDHIKILGARIEIC